MPFKGPTISANSTHRLADKTAVLRAGGLMGDPELSYEIHLSPAPPQAQQGGKTEVNWEMSLARGIACHLPWSLMCILSEGIRKNPAKAAEVEGEPDLSLAKLAALNRAKCSRGPSSYPTRLQQAQINEKSNDSSNP